MGVSQTTVVISGLCSLEVDVGVHAAGTENTI